MSMIFSEIFVLLYAVNLRRLFSFFFGGLAWCARDVFAVYGSIFHCVRLRCEPFDNDIGCAMGLGYVCNETIHARLELKRTGQNIALGCVLN